ncbi:MAG: protein arginine kinase [Clostridiales bacterium]|jgi:protein arginine kinase|nr:protein arginine kinase [Eubacteriales bacterium]MDH7566276.1 protein arginine kinase [Clostridiales bacterium]
MKGTVNEKGPESDVVISSRVRLARNLKDYPFPFKMNKEQQNEVLNIIKDSVLNDNDPLLKDIKYYGISSLNPVERQALVEKHLISRELAESQKESGILLSSGEKVCIMINEEDHLRLQCIFPGMQIDKAWDLCNSMDSMLEKKVKFAFDDHYGYLTCCPTNLGTGIRASAMIHLPALVMTGYIKGVLDACGKLGVAVRGRYGENSEASGNIFQISNQMTLGLTEEEIITHITNVTFQIIEQERALRNELYKQNPIRFEDKVFRSLGVFSNARTISTEESLKLLSDVRLGVDMGIIKNISMDTLNEIMLLIQPANLQKYARKLLNPAERDVMRAEVIRLKLSQNGQPTKGD